MSDIAEYTKLIKSIYNNIFELVLDCGSYRNRLMSEFLKENKDAAECLFGKQLEPCPPYEWKISENSVNDYLQDYYNSIEVFNVFIKLTNANDALFFEALKVNELRKRLDVIEEQLFDANEIYKAIIKSIS